MKIWPVVSIICLQTLWRKLFSIQIPLPFELAVRQKTEMAKRRDRRVAPSPGRPKNRVESAARLDQFSDSASDRKLITIFVIFFIVIPTVSVLLYCTKYSTRASRSVTHVHQRGLVKTDVNYQEILTVSTACILLLWVMMYSTVILFIISYMKRCVNWNFTEYFRRIQRFQRMRLIGITRIPYWPILLHGQFTKRLHLDFDV